MSMITASPLSSSIPEMNFPDLPIARYRFFFITQKALVLPFFAGSLLRGVFGHALKVNCCITGEKVCKSCPLYQSCLYTNIFEPPPREHSLQKLSQIPACYVIEPPAMGQQQLQAGDRFSFTMVLWGKALEQLSLLISCWQRAGQYGLGRDRVPVNLISVSLCGADERVVWESHSPVVEASQQNTLHSCNAEWQQYCFTVQYSIAFTA